MAIPIIGTTSCLIYLFKDAFVSLITNDPEVKSKIFSIIWLISFNTFPDGYKGMLKGIITALGLQSYCSIINLIGHWGINLNLQYYLAITCEMGLKGQWVAKLVLEFFIASTYHGLISCQNWQKVSEKAVLRIKKEQDEKSKESDKFNKAIN